jgi:hypothetical protein
MLGKGLKNTSLGIYHLSGGVFLIIEVFGFEK